MNKNVKIACYTGGIIAASIGTVYGLASTEIFDNNSGTAPSENAVVQTDNNMSSNSQNTYEISDNTSVTFDPDSDEIIVTITSTPTVKADVTSSPIPTKKPESSNTPTLVPNKTNTPTPTVLPSKDVPSVIPSNNNSSSTPTKAPSVPVNTPKVENNSPTSVPTKAPTSAPTKAPANTVTTAPTKAPVSTPTKEPTKAPVVSCSHDNVTYYFSKSTKYRSETKPAYDEQKIVRECMACGGCGKWSDEFPSFDAFTDHCGWECKSGYGGPMYRYETVHHDAETVQIPYNVYTIQYTKCDKCGDKCYDETGETFDEDEFNMVKSWYNVSIQ